MCFGTKIAINLPTASSDHLAMLVDVHCKGNARRRGRPPFRFEEKWAHKPDCETVIRKAWEAVEAHGSPMHVVVEKIKRSCQALREWSGHAQGGVRK